MITRAIRDAGLVTHKLPDGMRLRRAGSRTFVFNYARSALDLPASLGGELIMGERRLGPAGVTVLDDA